MVQAMKNTLRLLTFALALGLVSGPSAAACLAEYKAKRDNPLRLDYGIRTVPDSACTPSGARAYLAPRLADEGWTLLNIVSVRKDD